VEFSRLLYPSRNVSAEISIFQLPKFTKMLIFHQFFTSVAPTTFLVQTGFFRFSQPLFWFRLVRFGSDWFFVVRPVATPNQNVFSFCISKFSTIVRPSKSQYAIADKKEPVLYYL